ncbi:MAG TPA: hypothetical protein VMH23_13125 [Bacteroidota bacterium]|nr:hypothetical protein [Bacteroidota bacterium]
MTHDAPRDELAEERPPLFRTWRRLYTFVLAELALLIILFYLFTKAFA